MRGTSTFGSGVRCEVSWFWREWRGSSSPPSKKPSHRAGSLGRLVPRRAGPRWLQALIQNPRAASRGKLRLDGLIILFVACDGPRRGIGGGPVHHAGLNRHERLADPSVPSFATPNSWFDLTPRFSQRAERRRRTRRLRHAHSATERAAVELIETNSISVIGPRNS